ncbi:MAG: NifB/NifX family molybdenum-iron cluster-binding protein [Asgard group archaeon]|nr:NifB/NifX family molybdenum-iron cluster-binding protein [Asgard group archaeon]
MKIAIPVQTENDYQSQLAVHFGRAPAFAIYEKDKDKLEMISNQSNHFGGKNAPPELLHNHGVSVLICRGLGRKAIDLFDQLGITVYLSNDNTVKQALSSFENDDLRCASKTDGCAGKHGHSHKH